MKNWKFFAGIALAAIITFAMIACDNDTTTPGGDKTALGGSVSIPAEVVVNHEVQADTNELGGSGTRSYQWMRSASATGDFTDIAGATSQTFMVNLDVGAFIKVRVTRENNTGHIDSNVARVINASEMTVSSDLPDGAVIISTTLHEATSANPAFSITPAPGGGAAYFVENAKVIQGPGAEGGRYELAFLLDKAIDLSGYEYLEYDIMGDTIEILRDIVGHYPRFYNSTGDDANFWQYEANSQYRFHVDPTTATGLTWFRVRVPISSGTATHAGDYNFMSNVDTIRLRYIASGTEMEGRIYFRNIAIIGDGGDGPGTDPDPGLEVEYNLGGARISEFKIEGDPANLTVGTEEKDGHNGFFVSNSQAANDAMYEIQFAMEQNFNASGADYFVFDIAANYDMLDGLSNLYLRFKSKVSDTEWRSDVAVHFGIRGSLIDGIRGNADIRNTWNTVKVPISERAGWNLNQGSELTPEQRAEVLSNITIFMPRLQFRNNDYDYILQPHEDRIYFKNFRLETDDTLEVDPGLWDQIELNLPEDRRVNQNEYKVTGAPDARWGTAYAPDNTAAYYVSNAANGDIEILLNHPAINLFSLNTEYVLFDIHADSLKALEVVDEFYFRIRRRDPWNHIQFNATEIFKNAVSGANNESQWLTIKIPVHFHEGIHEITGNNVGGANQQQYNDTMSNFVMFVPRFIINNSLAEYETVRTQKIYFKNFRFEFGDGPGPDPGPVPYDLNGAVISEGEIKAVNGAVNDGSFGKVMKDSKAAYHLSNTRGVSSETNWSTLEFTMQQNATINATGFDYLSFDFNADSFDALNIFSNLYVRLRDSSWGKFVQYNANLRDDYTDKQGGQIKWFTITIPLAQAGAHDVTGEGADYNDVISDIRQIMLRFELRDDVGAPSYESIADDKLYFSNFRLGKSDGGPQPDPSLVVASNLPGDATINDGEFKVVEAAGAVSGKILAPDGEPAYFISNARSAGNFYEIEFAINGTFDTTGFDYFVFDMSADSFDSLNLLAGLYFRLKQPGVWHHIQFEANGVLRGAIDGANGQANWITIKVPIGFNGGDFHEGNPDKSQQTYDNVMANIGQIMPRFALRNDGDAPAYNPNDKYYFRNFRLEN